MKDKSQMIIYIVLIVAAFGLLFYLAGRSDKKYNWSESYHTRSKEPLNNFLISELLKKQRGDNFVVLNGPLKKSLPLTADSSAYLFIGHQIFFSRGDIDSLLKFVSQGNSAFISAHYFPKTLMDTLFPEACTEWKGNYELTDSIVTLNFYHPSLKTENGFLFKTPVMALDTTRQYEWNSFNKNFFCDSLMISSLGYMRNQTGDNYINFIRKNYGDGNFYFHTTPVSFTNYHLIHSQGKGYAERALSHLPPGKLYWEEYNKIPHFEDRDGGGLGAGPLKLIFSNPTLKNAWYILLALILLYIIFFAKRRQKIIPIVEPNTNTSLEFIKTVGTLYFQQSKHRRLMKLKIRYFLSFIRQKYHLSTNEIDEELIKRISLKSGIQQQHISDIFKQSYIINRYDQEVNAEDLIRLHQSLDYFYKNCK
ncbi:MAG: hypothetical protein ACK40G_14380 [Cytophagaceae bacterium]